MVDTWQSVLARKERCQSFVKCFGAWLTFFPYLETSEQVELQGLDHWTYETGVPRAIRVIPIVIPVYFPWRTDILMLERKDSRDKVTVLKQDICSEEWLSIQIQRHIFQIHASDQSLRMLKSDGSSKFTVIEKTPMSQKRLFQSLCNMADQFIFVTGGRDDNWDALSSVERYDIAKDSWKEMPPMKVARLNHGSCTIGTTVYVLCGKNWDIDHINSVEKLSTRDRQASWQLIQMPPTSLLTPRRDPVVAALDSNKILVMGGFSGHCLADAFIFETGTNSMERVVQETPFSFLYYDQSAHIRPGVVVAMVEVSQYLKILIEYRSGTIHWLHTIVN